MNHPYDFGPGKLFFRPCDDDSAAWASFGDLTSLSLSAAPLAGGRTESWSGNRGRLPGQPLAGTLALSAVLHALNPVSLAELVGGVVAEQAAGSVVDYALPPVVPGSEVRLPDLGVSGLVITDSAAAPVTIAPEHYALNGAFGAIVFTSLPEAPAPTQPLRAAYAHQASQRVGLLEAAPRPLALRYECINYAAGNAALVLELWRVEIARLKDLVLVDQGRALRGVPLSGDVLLDTTRAQPGLLGGFGQVSQVVTDWSQADLRCPVEALKAFI